MMTVEEIQVKRDRMRDFQAVGPLWELLLVLKGIEATLEQILQAVKADGVDRP